MLVRSSDMFTRCYSLLRHVTTRSRKDEPGKWSSEEKSKSSMVKVQVSFQMSPSKKRPVMMIEDFSISDDTHHQSLEKRPMRSRKETCNDHQGFQSVMIIENRKVSFQMSRVTRLTFQMSRLKRDL